MSLPTLAELRAAIDAAGKRGWVVAPGCYLNKEALCMCPLSAYATREFTMPASPETRLTTELIFEHLRNGGMLEHERKAFAAGFDGNSWGFVSGGDASHAAWELSQQLRAELGMSRHGEALR